jgi:uncharacterized protein (TIGR02246 family)
MKRHRIAASLAIAVTLWLFGGYSISQASPKEEKEGEDTAELVSVLDHVWLNAARNRDTTTMSWLFSDQFVEMHAGGQVVDKEKQVGQIRNSATDLTEIHPDDIQVRYVSPDVAILTDTTTIKGSRAGVDIGGQYHVLRVFAREEGRWRAAAAGLVRLGPLPPGGAPSEEVESKNDGGAVSQEVAELDRKWLNAALTGQAGYMAQLFSPHFIEIHSNGEIVTGRQHIEQVKSPTHKFTVLHSDDIHVRYQSPNLVILSDTTTMEGSTQGRAITGKYRTLRVFVKQNGKWRAAAAALTPLAG